MDWILVGLSLIDVIVLSIWFFVDPQTRKLEIFQLENPADTEVDNKIRPILEHCESKHQTIWLGNLIQLFSISLIDLLQRVITILGIVYGYKGLLLIFGLFLAYETRSMKGMRLIKI